MIHPTLLSLATRMEPFVPPDLKAGFPSWLRRNAESLNTRLKHALRDRLQIVELFAGIGGLGVGLEAALNAISILQAERVPERRAVLNARFPLAYQLDDVDRVLDFTLPVQQDQLVVAGGFPCRGASRANIHGQIGMANEQTGLWSVMAEVIRAWSPAVVITENVVSLRSRGLDVVLRDLLDAGYHVIWGRLDASDFGAPHERGRLFCIGIRGNAPVHAVTPRAHRSEWLPWASPIPPNDFKSPGKRARVAALGDSVVPICAYTVGLLAVKLLSGWRPLLTDCKRASWDALPTNGWATPEGLLALPASPFELPARVDGQRWVTFDERFENPSMHIDDCTYPPGIGRIYWWDGESDNLDVELPGSEVMPFPPEWVKEGPWPTAVACDAKNLGARGQFCRNAPGLNALVQTDTWIAEDGKYAYRLLEEHFAGRGVGPAFLEWMFGYPAGWTDVMASAASTSSATRKAA